MGGWLKNLFRRKQKQEIAGVTEIEEDWDQLELNRRDTDFHNSRQREQYLLGCLSQIKDAGEQLDQLQYEYDLVTADLKDTEELEHLLETPSQRVTDYAKKLITLQNDRKSVCNQQVKMPEDKFLQMDKVRDEMPQGYEKLKKSEEYQKLIKSDLKKLESEKQAYLYRKEELEDMKTQMKGILIVCMVAGGCCLLLLLVLQFLFDMDAVIGYLLLVLLTAVALTVLGIKYLDAGNEEKRVHMSLCKLIGMQNTVKIRYVNNTNLLDYLYVKFFVGSAEELNRLWEQYLLESARREKLLQNKEDYDYYCKELTLILRNCGLHDTAVWLHQLPALIDQREMVEIRHGLILRRQKLRKQMEYNRNTADAAEKEISEIQSMYPQYADHIREIIERVG